MRTVSNVLDHKGTEIVTIEPTASVFDALARMAERNIGALLVLEGERIVGIFSERDYARKVILRGGSSRELRVEQIMTPRPLCVGRLHSVEECMAIMTDQRVRHLPVVDDGRLVGVISIGDVVKSMIADREQTIEQLEEYIRTAG